MDQDSKLRPFYLAKILYERTDEDHYLTTAELMEILEKEYGFKVHRQTIPADVAALRSFGMEIQEVMSSQKRYNLISMRWNPPSSSPRKKVRSWWPSSLRWLAGTRQRI